jgi:hypothetical protein
MKSVDTSEILTKRNRKAISIKLHPKTLRMLELLTNELELTRTHIIEGAIWEAFTAELLADTKTNQKVNKKISSEFPK